MHFYWCFQAKRGSNHKCLVVDREDCVKWKSYDEVTLRQDMGDFIKAQRNRGPHSDIIKCKITRRPHNEPLR